MASSSEIDLVKTTLGNYKERGVTDNTLRLTPFLKCLEACGLKQYKSSTESSIWGKFCDKGKKVNIDKIATEVIDAIALGAASAKGVKNATCEHPDVQKIAADIRCKLAAKSGEAAVKAGKVDATTARMTDTSKYTGSHKERFDESGKGKGMEGRAEMVQNTGYVGNYMNADTYDKTHK